jgi:DNA helicase II / ATP-dependent DNA helicase PcrA
LCKNKDFFDRKKKELGVFLNEVQKRAVLHTEGPLLLLASPGSGKTTTTIMRIGYLIVTVLEMTILKMLNIYNATRTVAPEELTTSTSNLVS